MRLNSVWGLLLLGIVSISFATLSNHYSPQLSLRWGVFNVLTQQGEFVLRSDSLLVDSYRFGPAQTILMVNEEPRPISPETVPVSRRLHAFLQLLAFPFSKSLDIPVSTDYGLEGKFEIKNDSKNLVYRISFTKIPAQAEVLKVGFRFSPEDSVRINDRNLPLIKELGDEQMLTDTDKSISLFNDQLTEGIQFTLPEEHSASIDFDDHIIIFTVPVQNDRFFVFEQPLVLLTPLYE